MKFRDLATTALAISMLAAGPALAQTQSGSAQDSMGTQGSQMTETSQPPMSQSMVKHLQETLQQRGLYQGQVDGIYGPETKAAVQKFQQENNLQATGKLNVRTLSELGVIGHEQTAERNTAGESGMQNGMNAGQHESAMNAPGQNGTSESGLSQGSASHEATGQTGNMNSAENGATAGSHAMTGGQQQATAGQSSAENGSQQSAENGSQNSAENGSQQSAENGTAAGSQGAAQQNGMKTAENAHGPQSASPGESSQHSTAATGATNSGTGSTETTGSGH